jgi:hypothetical protein
MFGSGRAASKKSRIVTDLVFKSEQTNECITKLQKPTFLVTGSFLEIGSSQAGLEFLISLSQSPEC